MKVPLGAARNASCAACSVVLALALMDVEQQVDRAHRAHGQVGALRTGHADAMSSLRRSGGYP